MVMLHPDIQWSLNEILRACRQSHRRFTDAAAKETNPELQGLLEQYAEQREDFAAEIRAEIERLGGFPTAEEGEEPVDETVENDDSKVLGLYEEALDKEIPFELQQVLERQSIQIEEAHEHLAEIKNMPLSDAAENSDSPPDKDAEED
jgi:hypothetical protein